MLFGEKLRELRNKADISINELGKIAEISPSYVSKLENNPEKSPSKEMIFKIVYALRRGDKTDGKVNGGYMEILQSLLKSENLELNKGEKPQILYEDFPNFLKQMSNVNMKKLNKMLDENFNNLYSVSRKNGEVTNLDKPYFDLEWLLSQENFYLMYGRNLMINEEVVKKYDKYEFHNILNLEDIRIIREIVKAYFHNKYEPIINSREIFEHEIRKKSQSLQMQSILEILSDTSISEDEQKSMIYNILKDVKDEEVKRKVLETISFKSED